MVIGAFIKGAGRFAKSLARQAKRRKRVSPAANEAKRPPSGKLSKTGQSTSDALVKSKIAKKGPRTLEEKGVKRRPGDVDMNAAGFPMQRSVKPRGFAPGAQAKAEANLKALKKRRASPEFKKAARTERAALKKRIDAITSTFGATVKKNAKNAKADFNRRSKAAKKGARTRADRTGGPGPGSSGGF